MPDRREQTFYVPGRLLAAIQAEATRLDTSLSICVCRAWRLARGELATLASAPPIDPVAPGIEPGDPIHEDPSTIHPRAEAIFAERFRDDDANTRKQQLMVPEGLLLEIQTEATRLDRSLSWCVQRAWCLAADEIASLASITD